MFIKRGKRKLAQHLKKIFPVWVCAFFDPSPEVAKLARENFDMAFPKDRQGSLFKMTYKNFLHFANEQLRQGEDMTKEAGVSKELKEDNFDRITSSVLLALSYSFQFIQEWEQVD